jgi:hypothetical protein
MSKCKFKVGDKVRIVRNTGNSSKDKFVGKIVTIGEVNPINLYPYILNPDNGWLWRDDDFELVVCQEKIVITTDGKTTTAVKYCEDGKKVTATAKCSPEDTFDFNVGAKLAMERLMEAVAPVISRGFKVGDRVHVDKFNGTVICIDYVGCLGVEFDDVPNHPGIHNCTAVPLKTGATGNYSRCKWYYPDDLEHGEYVPQYYNGKVVCVETVPGNSNAYTVGKIYEFVNGKMTDDYGVKTPMWRKITSFEDWEKYSYSKWLEIKE